MRFDGDDYDRYGGGGILLIINHQSRILYNLIYVVVVGTNTASIQYIIIVIYDLIF